MCSLIEEFHNVLQNCSSNPAVLYWEDSNVCTISYKEVEQFCKSIIDIIVSDIREEYICVGLFMEHNYLIPPLIISLHKSNTSFIFLDPHGNPEDNLSLIKTLKLKWIFSNTNKKEDFLIKYALERRRFHINLLKLWEINFIEKTDNSFKNICYVIGTSGTTGKQKIVKVEHNCIMSNIISLRQKFKLTREDILYFGTPLTFDPSIVELFLAITTGACLLIAPTKLKLNSTRLLSILFPKVTSTYKGVTFLQMVPSLFLRWSQIDIEYVLQKTSCRILAFGGEKFPESILKLHKSRQLRIFNLYGITEVSCWASVYEVVNPNEEIRLGESLDDTVLEVRNEEGLMISSGEGELYIGSPLRICYIDGEDSSSLMKPIFRATGDIVDIKNNKDIVYIGRKDYIIKRLGYKINLLEIQEYIFKHTDITNICIHIEDGHKLILFLKILEFNPITKEKIIDKVRVKLLHALPKQYFPDHIEIISHFPLTPHGKIDKMLLEKTYNHRSDSEQFTDSKNAFLFLLSKYLGLNCTEAEKYQDYNFMEVGGNSISAIQLLSEFQDLNNLKGTEDLTTLLFEDSLKNCLDYVSSNIKINKSAKRKKDCDDKHNNKVHITEGNEKRQQKNNIALDVCWKVDLKACIDCSPTVIENGNETLVAIGSFSHIFAVINSLNGKIVSQTILPDSIESAGLVSSSNTYIYVGCHDGNMYCIDYITGAIIWKYSTDDVIKCTPCFCLKDQVIAFGSYDKHIHCIRAEDGILLWKTLYESVTSNPVFYEEKIYVATIYGTCLCLNANNGEILWKYKVDAPIFGSPCIYQNSNSNFIVWPAVNGTLHCFSCKTGKMEWTFRANEKIFSSLLWYDDNIIFGCHDHQIYCVHVDQVGCTVKHMILLDSAINSKPYLMLYDDEIYIIASSNNGNVYIINFHDGIITNLKLPGQAFSSPALKNNKVYIGCRDNNLYCINIINK